MSDQRMDAKVSAVLDRYHRRIAEERAFGRGPNADTGTDQRLLAVGPDTGQLINVIARSLPTPHILEVGTSFGYSTVWLAAAARASGGRLTTMELHPHKSAHAQDMLREAGLADLVDFRIGDAVEMIAKLPAGIDFVLLDLWKSLYEPCLEAFYPKLNPGAIVVADNMIRPGGDGVARYAHAVRSKPGIRSVLLPVGTGLEISVFAPDETARDEAD